MKTLIENFSKQLNEALKIGEKASLTKRGKSFDAVIISGLGGSGIGGSIAAEILKPAVEVPVIVNKGYHLPAFAGENTLVMACSYSGNTEETLNTAQEALGRKCELAVITSGGELGKMAEKESLNVITIPAGNPPRAMLAYSLTSLFFMLHHYELRSDDFISNINEAGLLVKKYADEIRDEARKVASELRDKTPAIYACEGFEGVAVRFRQQLNENSKMPAWDGVIPEMNHNELVGWAGGNENHAVVFFRSSLEYPRNSRRVEINKTIIGRNVKNIVEVHSRGQSHLAQSLYLIHLGDWISYFLADLNGVDVTEVKVIDFLKGELSKED